MAARRFMRMAICISASCVLLAVVIFYWMERSLLRDFPVANPSIMKKKVDLLEVEMTKVEAEVRKYLRQEDLRKDLKKQEINRRQFQAVKYLQKYGQIQSHEYAKRFRCSRETAVQDLKELVGRGILDIQGSGPQLRYVLK